MQDLTTREPEGLEPIADDRETKTEEEHEMRREDEE